MLLAVDVGNTNTVIGIYQDDKPVGFWRIRTRQETTADEYRITLHNLISLEGIKSLDIHGAIISCVVPPLNGPLENL